MSPVSASITPPDSSAAKTWARRASKACSRTIGSMRATIGVFLAIPMSVLAAIIMLYMGGSSINTMILAGFALVSAFIWFSENIGTFTKTWLYPSQHHAWAMVSPAKLGSWFLLLIISYTLVSLINPPRAIARREAPSRVAAPKSAAA